MKNTKDSLRERLCKLIDSNKYDKELTDYLGLLIDAIDELKKPNCETYL